MIQSVFKRSFVIALGFGLSPNLVSLRAADLDPGTENVLGLVEELKVRLSITAPVRVVFVDDDSRLVSVRPAADVSEGFELRFERAFLEQLGDDELEAVVAHELGHVWIYTHHPYLQTEDLANEIASRAVSRSTLERVYVKVRDYRENRQEPLGAEPVIEALPAGH